MPARRFSDILYSSDEGALFSVSMSLLAKNSSGTAGPPRSLHLHLGEAPQIDSPSSDLRRSERILDQLDQGTPPKVYAPLPMVYPLFNGVNKREREAIEALEFPMSPEEKRFQPYCIDCLQKNRNRLRHSRIMEGIIEKQKLILDRYPSRNVETSAAAVIPSSLDAEVQEITTTNGIIPETPSPHPERMVQEESSSTDQTPLSTPPCTQSEPPIYAATSAWEQTAVYQEESSSSTERGTLRPAHEKPASPQRPRYHHLEVPTSSNYDSRTTQWVLDQTPLPQQAWPSSASYPYPVYVSDEQNLQYYKEKVEQYENKLLYRAAESRGSAFDVVRSDLWPNSFQNQHR